MSTTTENNEQLQASIENLYILFAEYPLRDNIDACSCCTSDEDQQRIRSKPLQLLSGKDLERYAGKAMTTWGDQDDFRHFLPRLFQLLTIKQEWWIDPEIVLSKLNYAEWCKWPQVEQQAIEDFFMAMWRLALDNFPWYLRIDDAICAVAQAVDDINPYLNYWQQICVQRSSARCQLSYFIDSSLDHVINKGELGVFWEERQSQMHQAIRWMVSPAVVELLPQAYDDYEQIEDVDPNEMTGTDAAAKIMQWRDYILSRLGS